MTVLNIILTGIIGIVSSILATYIVRFLDKIIHKNDRHSPKFGR